MINKNDLLESMIVDLKICKTLFKSMPTGGLDYKPAENMRSMVELLQYLCIVGTATFEVVKAGSLDAYAPFAEKAASLDIKNFPALMDEQISALQVAFSNITDEEFAEKETTLPWGEKGPLGKLLLKSTAKFVTAYKMQFFLYLKQAGAKDLGTPDCWFTEA